MTLAQLVILVDVEQEMQRKSKRPASTPASMMDAAALARMASVRPPD